MPGPNKRPASETELRGNPGKRPPEPERKSVTGAPEMPAGLGKDGEALWRLVVAELTRRGTVEQCDGPALEAYCRAWQRHQDAVRDIEDWGPFYSNSRGDRIKHPGFQVIKDCVAIMNTYEAKFGMTPRDRQNLGLAPSDPDEGSDPFD